MKLREVHIKGFKSIDGQAEQKISLGNVTVLLGANGSGKSNLISFFNMLSSMTSRELNQYVGKRGVSSLLFYGPKKTDFIYFYLQFEFDDRIANYTATLSFSTQDNLFINFEKIECWRKLDERVYNNPSRETIFDVFKESQVDTYFLDKSSSESELQNDTRDTSRRLFEFLSNIRIYQFNDTSNTARIKDRVYVDAAKYLYSDAGNLAPFLKMLKGHSKYKKYYERIVQHIQRVMPQFADFDLEPIPGADNYVRLNWKDTSGNDYLFGPDQISDGSLRFMALATLLLQPPDLLPKFIVLDEPELGLHPAAIAELGGLVRIAAQNTQVLLATQSMRLVDEFLPEELVVVEWDEQKRCSVFKKFEAEQLSDWLNRYSLSELWEKNVLGGQP